MSDINIYNTKEYDQFQHYPSNRKILPKTLKALMSDPTFPKIQYTCPIIVNKDFYVIDGQHRLEACKRLGIPAHYIIYPEATEADMIRFNVQQNSWKGADFIHTFSFTKPSYKFLADMSELHSNISMSFIVNSTAHMAGKQLHKLNSKLKAGLFELTEEEIRETKSFLNIIIPLLKEVKKVKGQKASPLFYNSYLGAFSLIYKTELKMFEKISEKIVVTALEIPYLTKVEDALKFLVKVSQWKPLRSQMNMFENDMFGYQEEAI